MSLTKDDVQAIFNYDKKTGQLLWGIILNKKMTVGQPAGTLRKDGYIQIKFQGINYLAHRLIYLYHHGYIPTIIDHINRDTSDNRIENLRAVTQTINQRNNKRNKTSGIFFVKRLNKYKVQICGNYLGVFISFNDALIAANKYKAENKYLNYET